MAIFEDMGNRAKLFVLLFAVGFGACACAQGGPNVQGYVTRVGSATDFSVDGTKIELTSDTTFYTKDAQGNLTEVKIPAPYFGESANVYGKFHDKTNSLTARKVVLLLPREIQVKGTAVVDRVLDQDGLRRLVRIDGLLVDVSAGDLKASGAPTGPGALPKLSGDLKTNEWVTYNGKQRPDGTVVLTGATVSDNVVKPGEAKLKATKEFDPSAVSEKDRQSGADKFFEGTNFKRIPAYKNEDEQARIDRIGASLIPAYQKDLAKDDPTKINFRFQLVDERKWRDAIALVSGIILVPRQLVERLPNDSQLAAVLADNIACVLEKQTYRLQGIRRVMTAASTAASVAQVLVPLVGFAGSGALALKEMSLEKAEQEQSGRVALGLLYDAGYDLTQAPEAWWTLATKPGHDPHERSAPDRANNLYQALGTTWRETLQKAGAKS